jgi:hypothetical protein
VVVEPATRLFAPRRIEPIAHIDVAVDLDPVELIARRLVNSLRAGI